MRLSQGERRLSSLNQFLDSAHSGQCYSTMLLNIHIHDSFLASLGFDFGEEGSLLHGMVAVKDFRPAFCIGDKVGVVFWSYVRSLSVDAIEASDEDVVPQCHYAGCFYILIIWLLRTS
jgi:hypothetical protein